MGYPGDCACAGRCVYRQCGAARSEHTQRRVATGRYTVGGLTEGFVDDLFAPIRAKGGWGGVVGIKTPGAEEARAIKEANKSPTRRAMEEKIKAREAARLQAFPP